VRALLATTSAKKHKAAANFILRNRVRGSHRL
jgi:hypothetical protein